MNVAYVDTSALLAVEFNESGADALARRLNSFTRLVSANLLEAELRAALLREERTFSAGVLAGLDWVFPDRPLSSEIALALAVGYLRGADLWHVATALYVSPTPGGIAFITADNRQSEVAAALGFER